jgi:hypothetical protein
MPLFERDQNQQAGSPAGSPRNASAGSGSNAQTEDSAAHIAELVRRTAERHAGPGTAPLTPTEPTVPQPPPSMPVPPLPPAVPIPPVTHRAAQPGTPAVRPAIRRPPLRVLVAAGAVAVILIAGAFALSHRGTPGGAPVSAPQTRSTAAASGYAVKVTDVITDCADHSYGRTKRSFTVRNCVMATRSLATGQVSGRPVLFVTSRITMASVEAAASIKQILDANGTGNLNDLLREGKTFPGAPARMPSSGYASVQTGAVVLVAEAGFADGGSSSNTDPALRAAAAQVAALGTTAG